MTENDLAPADFIPLPLPQALQENHPSSFQTDLSTSVNNDIRKEPCGVSHSSPYFYVDKKNERPSLNCRYRFAMTAVYFSNSEPEPIFVGPNFMKTIIDYSFRILMHFEQIIQKQILMEKPVVLGQVEIMW